MAGWKEEEIAKEWSKSVVLRVCAVERKTRSGLCHPGGPCALPQISHDLFRGITQGAPLSLPAQLCQLRLAEDPRARVKGLALWTFEREGTAMTVDHVDDQLGVLPVFVL